MIRSVFLADQAVLLHNQQHYSSNYSKDVFLQIIIVNFQEWLLTSSKVPQKVINLKILV